MAQRREPEHRSRGQSSLPTQVFSDIPERYREHLVRLQAEAYGAQDRAIAAETEARLAREEVRQLRAAAQAREAGVRQSVQVVAAAVCFSCLTSVVAALAVAWHVAQ